VKQEDAKLLDDFLNGLGGSDTTGQMSYCSMYLKRIFNNIENARKDSEEKYKLYGILGVLAGVSISIIII